MSNDSDLRAAAERVQLFLKRPATLGVWQHGDYTFGFAKMLASFEMLAKHVLASQPADGDFYQDRWNRLMLALRCPKCNCKSISLTDGYEPVWNCDGCKYRWDVNGDKEPQPADGEEAITEETDPVEYVDALGLRSRWCIARWTDGRYVLVLDQSDSDGPLDLDKCDQVVFPVTTDHDVRRLCGVLGIPLREGT